MWLEIEKVARAKGQRDQKTWDLTPEPVTEYEMRLCVFDCANIPTMDMEGTSDVYIKAFLDEHIKKTTDTHYRSMNGKPSFSYRMLFDVEMPRLDKSLTLQAWDRDMFKSNEFICEWTLDLSVLFKTVQMSGSSVHLSKTYYEKVL